MSDIRRYIPYSTPIYLSGESSPEPTTCVVLGRDHERIVAELRAQLEHSETKVSWLLRDNERVSKEKDAEVERLNEAMHNAASGLSTEIRQRMLLEKQLTEARAEVERLKIDNDRYRNGKANLQFDLTTATETIAMQKRVIDKLKNQRDSYVREPMQTEYCATKVIEDLNMEIEAIERGQL